MPPRVFCCESAEVIERIGDGLRSGAPLADRGRKERAERALQKAGGQAKESGLGEGWAVQSTGGQAEVALGITSNYRMYGK